MSHVNKILLELSTYSSVFSDFVKRVSQSVKSSDDWDMVYHKAKSYGYNDEVASDIADQLKAQTTGPETWGYES
jgi:hypothetical protein